MFGGHGLTGPAGPLFARFCQEDTPIKALRETLLGKRATCSVILKRQVSTQWEKIRTFLANLACREGEV